MPPWTASKPARFAQLGLADPTSTLLLPSKGTTADLLMFALVAPGADDPVTGIIDAVSVQLSALADAMPSEVLAATMHMLGRRLDVASVLLRRLDNRVQTPADEPEEDDVPGSDTEPPSSAP